MQKYWYLLFMLAITLSISAQRVEYDIFGDLSYSSMHDGYKAYLKKDIFDNLIYTDNFDNEIEFEKKYLDVSFKNILTDEAVKADYFLQLTHRYCMERGYKATYSIDIFDKVVIQDNRRIVQRVNVNPYYNNNRPTDNPNYRGSCIREDRLGDMEFNSENYKATLKRAVYDNHVYTDSNGNKLEISDRTWKRLIAKHGNAKNVFDILIAEFLY